VSLFFSHHGDDFLGLIGAATCPPFIIKWVVGWDLRFVLFLKSWVSIHKKYIPG